MISKKNGSFLKLKGEILKMKKIAIVTSTSKTQHFINQAYVDYVANAGFEPILITPRNNIVEMANMLDGLLLPGGVDIEPTFYGENNVASNAVEPEKDDFERQALHAFLEVGKNVFGICRGFQLIAREFMRIHENKGESDKLNYFQHISGHSTNNDRAIPRSAPAHNVEYNPVVLYNNGENQIKSMFVNSMHHQVLFIEPGKSDAVVRIDANNVLAAVAITNFCKPAKSKGSVVEAFDGLFKGTSIRAVQWHPEEMNDVAIIKTFFEGAAEGVKPKYAR